MKRISNLISHGAFALLLTASLIAAGSFTASAASKKSSTSAQSKTNLVVDVNSADAKTLEQLPGIGSSLANKIIAGRPYHSVDDLAKVKGLSQSKIDKIKDQVSFGPTTAATTETKPKKQTAKKETTTKSSKSTETAQTTKTPPASSSTGSKESTQPLTPTGKTSGTLAPGQRININTATAEQLEALPGIGPVKAQAIVDYRNEHGRFQKAEDIQNVKGIKEGEFSKIQDQIKISN
jgi:competence protein ComEA